MDSDGNQDFVGDMEISRNPHHYTIFQEDSQVMFVGWW